MQTFTISDLSFTYPTETAPALQNVSLSIEAGSFTVLCGRSGCGKSTLLRQLKPILQPHGTQTGTILFEGKSLSSLSQREQSARIGFVLQNLDAQLVTDKVWHELAFGLESLGLSTPVIRRRVAEIASFFGIQNWFYKPVCELSGGQKQLVNLASVMALEPSVLLLDEPTKGLDAEFKRVFARIIRRLCARGVCVIMVSHDAEFCASYASRCAMFFDGAIVAEGTPREFFSSGSFYTTSASRMARGLLPGAITPEDVIAACGGEVPPEPDLPADGGDAAEIQAQEEAREQAKTYLLPSQTAPLPLWRKLLGALGGLRALVCLWRILSISDLSELLTQGGLTSLAGDTFRLYLAMLACLLVLAVSFSRAAPQPVHSSLGGRPLSKRTRLASALSLLFVPLTIFIGIVYFGKKSYGVVSLLVLLECMAPFALIFEGRKPKARELVLIAALCALAVAGRAALFMLPGFKPVAALVILSGVAFGGETGFLVGAMSMLTSNVLFGQGPWTPFQMFAMGLIGFLAGVSFQKGLLRAGRAPLAIFGAVSVVLVYGGIMNPASALLWSNTINWKIILSYYVTGIPIDLVRALATFFFLWLTAEPLLQKLDRIKTKYGLAE